jgi:CheY-like chemotaxis protein
LVALPDAAARKTLRKILQEAGFTHCREVANLESLAEKLASGPVDLLITTLNERGWDSADIIRRIRQGELGNPFMLIMVLLDQPVPSVVDRVVNAGADDLLLAPWLDRLVLGRLDGLIHGRKPFLVTSDYIGPERRSHQRAVGPSAPAIEVPNPMHWLTVKSGSREELERSVEHAAAAVNLNKIKSCSNYLRVLADRVVTNFAKGGHAAIIPDILVMLAASEELVTRAANTQFAPAIELTEALRTLCQRLAREDRAARVAEVGVLPSLADAVVTAIYNSEPEPISAALQP